MPNELSIQLKTLSEKPGIYQFFDKKNSLLYIGKAKNIKKRVLSYFNKDHNSGKIKVMVSKIHRLETILVETEFDALLLENSLIKKHQPRYNSMLRDDKTYPWICIKKEAFPRVFLTRNPIKDGSDYFGPYPSVRMAKTLLDLIKSIYPIRTCALDLREEKIKLKKYKVCLEFHLGNCLGPCESLQTEESYSNNFIEIREMMKGNFIASLKSLTQLMKSYASQLLFEKAQFIKDKLEILEKYQAKSTIINSKIKNVDIFSIISDESFAYINFIKINNGAIIQSYTTEYKKIIDETEEEILTSAIIELRQRFQSTSNEIYIPFTINFKLNNIKITVPKMGDKRHLIDFSIRNAKEYKIEQLKKIKIIDPERHTNRIMQEMKTLLRLPTEPLHIEGFDNSNIQGSNPVSVCVVFKNGKPSKNDYRKYNIKTVEGPNDFASMEEVILRRYSRLLEEKAPLPHLIIIDGGKGQLSAAIKSLQKLGLENKISILGIAKRLEELFFPNDPIPLYLDKTSETLKVIQQVRNEAHRFSVSHHRNRRSNTSFLSEIETIKGIGEKTLVRLLQKYKSVKRVRELALQELENELGKSKANILYKALHNN